MEPGRQAKGTKGCRSRVGPPDSGGLFLFPWACLSSHEGWLKKGAFWPVLCPFGDSPAFSWKSTITSGQVVPAVGAMVTLAQGQCLSVNMGDPSGPAGQWATSPFWKFTRRSGSSTPSAIAETLARYGMMTR